MTDIDQASCDFDDLVQMVADAVQLADKLALSDVAVRLEQARLILVNRRD
jgi:hypothetical protein